MPIVYIKKIYPNSILGIWKIDETEEAMQLLSPQNFSEIFPSKKITHPQRLLEYLSVRILLLTLCDSMGLFVSKFYEDTKGKLHHLGSTFEFSFSHSFPFASVLVSNRKVGIDIEKPSAQILKIKDRFLSVAEQGIFSDSEEALCIAWTAKEALYKMLEEDCSFLTDLQIISYDAKKKYIRARFPFQNREALVRFFRFENVYVTYTLGN